MPDIYGRIETCSCGAMALEMGSNPLVIDERMHGWRWNHRCPRGSSKHYVDFLDQPCGVCGDPCADTFSMRVVNKIPVHTSCRVCVMCRKPLPDPMKWAEQYGVDGELPRGLYHWDCIPEQYRPRKVKRGKNGTFQPTLEPSKSPRGEKTNRKETDEDIFRALL